MLMIITCIIKLGRPENKLLWTWSKIINAFVLCFDRSENISEFDNKCFDLILEIQFIF